MRDILKVIVPHGWFVPVTPGTSYVTVGGAIASDVHGKNHHLVGTFCEHVLSITILLGNGDTVTASQDRLPDLFYATCGGMGLTGIVLSAVIKLIPIKSINILQTTIKTNCIDEVCEQFEEHRNFMYSVAWLDCMATGTSLGRSVLLLGEHANDQKLNMPESKIFSVPKGMPAALLNHWSISTFNRLYYAKARKYEVKTVHANPFFYVLDKIGHWNRLYGKAGFVQYQFVLPKEGGVQNMRKLLTRISSSNTGSFLTVLKQFRSQNKNYLSFPMAGYTLSLDFKLSESTLALLSVLDDMVLGMGGRIYLAKDALMTEQMFKGTYKRWPELEAVREKYGAVGKFSSAQSQRLGLL